MEHKLSVSRLFLEFIASQLKCYILCVQDDVVMPVDPSSASPASRLLSTGGQDAFEQFMETASQDMGTDKSRKCLLAFYAIQSACRDGRIEEEEKRQLRSEILRRQPLSRPIIEKLNLPERSALDIFVGVSPELPSQELMRLAELNIRERTELEHLRRQMIEFERPKIEKISPRPPSPKSDGAVGEASTTTCIICYDEKARVDCVDCPRNHSICTECFTNWVRALNEEKMDNTRKLEARGGKVYCPHETKDPLVRSNV